MEQHKALVIDDDPETVESITDILVSRGHANEVAGCQVEACDRLAAGDHTYVILDLAIPTRPKRSKPRLQNGMLLVEEILGSGRDLPVIVLVETGGEGAISLAEMVDAAATAVTMGAVHAVYKPFPPSGWTLDRAIDKATGKDEVAKPPRRRARQCKPKRPMPFQGGELVFHRNRVELCGVKILGDTGLGQSRAILELLARRKPKGRYVHLSGSKLAQAIEAEGGISTVTGCVRWLRGKIAARLKEECGLIVHRGDVIANDRRHGYCFNEWIEVRGLTAKESGSSGSTDAKKAASRDADPGEPEPVETDTDPISQRRRRVLAVLSEYKGLRAPDIAKRLKVSLPTAKRDLAALKREGAVEFVGSARAGHYILTERTAGQ